MTAPRNQAGPLADAPPDFDDALTEPAHRSVNWQFDEILGRQRAVYRMGSVSARVEEHDGRAVYEVRQGGEVIASGGDPDVEGSIEAVEAVLVEIGWLMLTPDEAERVAA